MSFSGFEYEARRVATDLNTGNTFDAAAVLRDELYRHPYEAGALIGRANQLSSPNRVDDILVDRVGNVAVANRYTGEEQYVGRLPSAYIPPVVIIGGWNWGHHRPGYPLPHPGYPHPGYPHPHPHPGYPLPHPGYPHPHPGHPHLGHPYPRPGHGGHRW